MKKLAYKVVIETNDADKTDDIMDVLERVAVVALADYDDIPEQLIGDVLFRLYVYMGELTKSHVGIEEILASTDEGSHPDHINNYRNRLLAIAGMCTRTLADMEIILSDMKGNA